MVSLLDDEQQLAPVLRIGGDNTGLLGLRAPGEPEMMVRHGTPLTRENYVTIANAGRDDEAWTAEHEATLPYIFRDEG